MEVFALPFMMLSPEATSKALWDYVEQYASAEFKDVKPLAFHVHGDGVFHMTKQPIKTAADLKKLRQGGDGVSIALIGEHLLRQKDPGAALKMMLQQ